MYLNLPLYKTLRQNNTKYRYVQLFKIYTDCTEFAGDLGTISGKERKGRFQPLFCKSDGEL
jgi:hypothetical protein